MRLRRWPLAVLVGCSPMDEPHPAPPAPDRVEAEAFVASAESSEPPGPSAATRGGEAPGIEEDTPVRPDKASTLHMAFVGDVIFGRYREAGFDPIVPDDVDPFAEIRPALRDAIVVANLETPVVAALPETSPSHSEHRFGADARHARRLAAAGIDVVTLANNHLYDLREAGLHESVDVLARAGVFAVGGATEDEPALRVQSYARDGWRVGFIAFTSRLNMQLPEGAPHVPFVRPKEIVERVGPLVDAAIVDHDAVVISVHWGDEYKDDAAWGQRQIARALIDRGASVVHGHHPHVLQGIEAHGTGVIAYSMGNFLFSNASKIPRLTGVLRVELGAPRCVRSARFVPAVIDRPTYRPVPAEGALGDRVRARVIELGAALDTRWEREPDSPALHVDIAACDGNGRDSEPGGEAAEHQDVGAQRAEQHDTEAAGGESPPP